MLLKCSLIIVAVSILNPVQGNNCDKLGILIYEDLGCKPIKKSGLECPVKYECDLAVENNACLFKGANISVGESIPEDDAYNSCRQGCLCRGIQPLNAEEEGETTHEERRKHPKKEIPTLTAEFQCAILDCPEWFEDTPLPEGCHRVFEVDNCCSVGKLCRKDKPTVCNVDGKRYLQGQRFYPKKSCSKCVCPKNFTGKFERPYCARLICNSQITYSKEILSYCAPFYPALEGQPLCCPTAWVCPTDAEIEIQTNPRTHKQRDLVCRFGKSSLKYGEAFETTVRDDSDSKEKRTKCECILPPFLTCREIYS